MQILYFNAIAGKRNRSAFCGNDGRRWTNNQKGPSTFSEGKYMLAGEILNKLVFAEPDNQEAKTSSRLF
jgi:alkyl sulfatase BDS1-like metallo-beta-lactamase superfamily hydrolase